MRAKRLCVGLTALAGCVALVMGGCGRSPVDQQAKAELLDRLGQITISVYPAAVRNGQQWEYDAQAAEQIAEWFNERGLARAVVLDEQIAIAGGWGHNQAAMYRASVADIAAHVSEHPIATDYAIVCEYLLGGGGKVMGVHIYLLKADGKLAYGALLNSHHPTFRSVSPANVADCTKVVLKKLEADLVPSRSQNQR